MTRAPRMRRCQTGHHDVGFDNGHAFKKKAHLVDQLVLHIICWRYTTFRSSQRTSDDHPRILIKGIREQQVCVVIILIQFPEIIMRRAAVYMCSAPGLDRLPSGLSQLSAIIFLPNKRRNPPFPYLLALDNINFSLVVLSTTVDT
jgi:hypothetical protein